MRSAFTILVLGLVLGSGSLATASASSAEVFGFSSEDTFGGSYLGVDTRDVTADRLASLNLKEETGVEVTLVDQDAPAGRAGIKEHDVILTVNGNKVESVEQLRRMIRELPPGRTIAIGLSRNGQPMSFKTELADRKRAFVGPEMQNFHFEMPAVAAIPPIPAIPDIDVPVSVVVVHSAMRSGLMVENLTPQLGEFFGARNGHGVLVRSVEKGSRAERAGFRAGDVIVRVNGEAVNDSSDFGHALRGRSKASVPVNIIRDKKEQTLTLTLPPRKESGALEESMSLDIDAQMDVQAVNAELVKIKPQIALAVNRLTPELAKMKEEMRRQAREFRKHAEELKKQFRERRGDI